MGIYNQILWFLSSSPQENKCFENDTCVFSVVHRYLENRKAFAKLLFDYRDCPTKQIPKPHILDSNGLWYSTFWLKRRTYHQNSFVLCQRHKFRAYLGNDMKKKVNGKHTFFKIQITVKKEQLKVSKQWQSISRFIICIGLKVFSSSRRQKTKILFFFFSF